MTHTHATLKVSAAAYDEIAEKLRAAGYRHALRDELIDMSEIALEREDPGQTSIAFDIPSGYFHCPVCKGRGADPMSDNVNWLPCQSCRGTGKANVSGRVR